MNKILADSLALCLLLGVLACKQNAPQRVGTATQAKSHGESLSLGPTLEVTGSIALVPMKAAHSAVFDQFGLVECNSSDLSAADEALRQLEMSGAILSEDLRAVDLPDKNILIDCHLLHPQAIVDSKSITLLNERILALSGFRQASRSDIAVYELTQLVWVGLQQGLRWHGQAISDELLFGSSDPSLKMALRKSLEGRLDSNSDVYNPCATVSPSAPRWLADDLSLRSRQFVCSDGKTIKLRIDATRPYAAVRNTLRAATMALFNDSRGMRPTADSGRSRSRFAISALQHSLDEGQSH